MILKQFSLVIGTTEDGKETISTSGNLNLDDVAAYLVRLAYQAGVTKGGEKEEAEEAS